jgi:hypothetical protein
LSVLGASLAACTSLPSPTGTTTAPSLATAPSSPPIAASALGHCHASDLAGSVTGTRATAGTVEVTVVMRNLTGSSCVLDGFPTAQLLDAGGDELPTDVVRGGSYPFTDFAPAPLTVAPGAVAYFNLGYSQEPTDGAPCETAAALWVTPPDDVEHLSLGQALTVCAGGALTLSPLFGPGAPGTETTTPTP